MWALAEIAAVRRWTLTSCSIAAGQSPASENGPSPLLVRGDAAGLRIIGAFLASL